MTATDETSTPRPRLSTFDAVMIIVGIVLGGGIFALPPAIASLTGSPSVMLFAWLAGAALSLVGALCYAELAAAFPHAGGDLHFLTRAYGRDVSFFFGWARVTVILTGSIALLGFVCGDYLTRVVDLGPRSSALYAALIIVALTALNMAGLKESARAQNVLTMIEVGGLLLVVAAGLAVSAPARAQQASLPADGGLPATFGLALVFVLFTFGGWNEAAYIAADVRGGRSGILKALMIAIAVLTATYLLFVFALVHGLGFDGLKESSAVGADVMRAAFGPLGEVLMGAVVAVAALTSMNATMIVGARTGFALGRDWPILGFMSGWDARRGVPRAALLVQAAIALALVGLAMVEESGVRTMVEFTSPVFWGFLALVGIAFFLLRFRFPDAPRPFTVPGYPVLPLAFIATSSYLFYSSLAYARSRNAVQVSLYVMAAGLAAWAIARLIRPGRYIYRPNVEQSITKR